MGETINLLHPETCGISNKVKTIETWEDNGGIPTPPPEIIVEILKRLPVKSLLRLRCVSKSWLYLISTSQFVKTHLDFSTNNPNFTNHRIVHTISNRTSNLKLSSVHSLLSEDATVASETDYPEKNPHKGVWVVGSCNGVICLVIEEKNIFLWNPSMRTSKKLPPLDVGLVYSWGFGFNECDDDYKVVAIQSVFRNSGGREYTVKICSLKADSWNMIENFKSGVPLHAPGKYASGKLHFEAITGVHMDSRWNIVSVDLKTEVCGMVEQPNYGDQGSNDYSSLGVLGGCLCVLRNSPGIRGEVWVLKEYNVKESWTRVISVTYTGDLYVSHFIHPLLMLPNGEVLLVSKMTFLVYNPKDNSFRHPEITNVDHSIAANMYVESLVSL